MSALESIFALREDLWFIPISLLGIYCAAFAKLGNFCLRSWFCFPLDYCNHFYCYKKSSLFLKNFYIYITQLIFFVFFKIQETNYYRLIIFSKRFEYFLTVSICHPNSSFLEWYILYKPPNLDSEVVEFGCYENGSTKKSIDSARFAHKVRQNVQKFASSVFLRTKIH